MSEIKHSKIEDLPASHKCEHEGYEYYGNDYYLMEKAIDTDSI